MGREIRRVPPDWEHPRGKNGYEPLHDESFREAAAKWKQNFLAWERGELPEYAEPADRLKYEYWEYAGDPPEREYYRPDWPEGSATHYQMYETVSEGTPVTPHFATKEELVDYLVKYGEFHDRRGGWDRKNAEAFVNREYAPSMIIESNGVNTRIIEPRDGGIDGR